MVDDTDQMDPLVLLSDADLDQLVVGQVPPGRDDLVALSSALGALRSRADAEPAPAMTPALRIQLADAEADSSARARPGRLAVVPPATDAGTRPRWRGAVGASAAALVLVAGMGAAAAQNVLPAAVQDAIAASAHLVGIDLPSSHDRHGPPLDTPGGSSPAVPGAPGEPTTPADPPAHGRDRQPETSTRDGSPSGDAPGQTSDPRSGDLPGGGRGDGPGEGTAPQPTVDPHRDDGQPSVDPPTVQDRSDGDDGGVPDPSDAPGQAPDGGDGGPTPGTPGSGGPGSGGPGGGGPGGGGPGGGGPGGGGPPARPQPQSGGQVGPAPTSGEGSASAAAGGDR